MHQLTKNFECWITKDGGYFTVHDILNNSADGGYKLGEYAVFEDEGIEYEVTINKNKDQETVDLRKK